MKKSALLFLPLASLLLTGCNQLKDLMNVFSNLNIGGSEESSEREQGNREGFEKAIDLINQKNYFMVYKAVVLNMPITVYYEIDENRVKLGDDYTDYSNANEDGYAWDYVYNSETGNYTKQMHDLSNEPASSRYLTREHLDASNYVYNEEKRCYEMKPAKLSYYGFEYSSITVSTVEDNRVKTIYIDTTIPSDNTDYSSSFTATLTQFGEASVSMPTNYVEA